MAAVALPMYDLPEVRDVTGAMLRAAVGEIPSPWPVFPDHETLNAHWLDPNLGLSQSCGLPLITDLNGRVETFGAFDHEVCEEPAHYRSVLMTRADNASLAARRPVINNIRSLSGSTSLWWALVRTGIEPDGPPLETGAHVLSVAALLDGRADLAAIDGYTLWLLRRFRPAAIEGLVEVGRGPLIPCTPLISAPGNPLGIDAARLGAAAVAGRAIGLTSFVPLTEAHYHDLVGPLHAAVTWPV